MPKSKELTQLIVIKKVLKLILIALIALIFVVFTTGKKVTTAIKAQTTPSLPQQDVNAKQEKQITTTIDKQGVSQLAQNDDYILVFIYSVDCPYCKKLAPLVKQLSKDYGFKVMAFSTSTAFLPEFKDSVPIIKPVMEKYFGNDANNYQFPLLVLQDNHNKSLDYYPVSVGYTEYADMQKVLQSYAKKLL